MKPRRRLAACLGMLAALGMGQNPAAVGGMFSVRPLQPTLVPSDDPAYAGNQWNLYGSYGIQAPAAWDLEQGSARQVVAVLDTGILAHEDLQGARILSGYDFVSDPFAANDGDGRDADPSDPGDAVAAGECGAGTPAADSSWHGLLVTGVIAATADNALGIAGIDWRARILPVRVLGKCGGEVADLADAVLWAAGARVAGVPANPSPATVINISAAGKGLCPPKLQAAVDEAWRRGVVVVAAAGNAAASQTGGDTAGVYPANCTHVLVVTATDVQGDRLGSAFGGDEVALAAPGREIVTLQNGGRTAPDAGNDRYVLASGTSLAAPHVAAAAALVRAVNPSLSPDQVRVVLTDHVQPFPAGSTCTVNDCGAGILDLHAAVAAAGSYTGASEVSGAAPAGSGGGGAFGWWLAGMLLFARRLSEC